jgi:hypothetical protein
VDRVEQAFLPRYSVAAQRVEGLRGAKLRGQYLNDGSGSATGNWGEWRGTVKYSQAKANAGVCKDENTVVNGVSVVD